MSGRVTRSMMAQEALASPSFTIKRTSEQTTKSVRGVSRAERELEHLLAGYTRDSPSLADMQLLRADTELNDELINSYLELLCRSHNARCADDDKVHSMSTFFLPKFAEFDHERVSRWTKKIDIFSLRLLLVPLHMEIMYCNRLSGHWCLGVVDMARKQVSVYDSLSREEETRQNHADANMIVDYLEKEWAARRPHLLFHVDTWNIVSPHCRQQRNFTDCGVFVLHFANMLVTGHKVPSVPSSRLRLAIARDLASQHIHHDSG